jgi:hypothetical protein
MPTFSRPQGGGAGPEKQGGKCGRESGTRMCDQEHGCNITNCVDVQMNEGEEDQTALLDGIPAGSKVTGLAFYCQDGSGRPASSCTAGKVQVSWVPGFKKVDLKNGPLSLPPFQARIPCQPLNPAHLVALYLCWISILNALCSKSVPLLVFPLWFAMTGLDHVLKIVIRMRLAPGMLSQDPKVCSCMRCPALLSQTASLLDRAGPL